ncbi:MAG: LysM peptidoglycan-binding domain-containing protein [Proteobacteria bacterium]|nr:LysM peptidoglycan-binding domain-containing protein [Pseudomonadota bacterium]MBU1451838.1 LysM peptidoglycan-binding domain-containing protein [Pseudomonadota bacterium]MBU2469033.1 LysM peptidoglycan-binding domain-containing protein [Pseudomonadota bacterium]MBU2517862.1 LysM peptidoglycan-binding domain-containing protein [Pseudomonadota bacterium]
MPKVLSSPKLPTGKGGGRRNFRLSPLEIGVAVLVAMGGVYLIYVLLSGLFGGAAEAPAPAGGPVGQGISPARLDKVLSAAEGAGRQLQDLEKRLVEMDKRLQQAGQQGGAPAAVGGDPKLAARVEALEKKLAGLPVAPAGKGKVAADPKLAARLDKLEKSLASLQKQNQDQAKALSGDQAKLAPQVAGLEKALASLQKQNQDLAKDLKKLEPPKAQAKLAARVAELEKQAKAKTAAAPPAPDKLDQRLASLEKQVKALSQGPAPKGGAPAAPGLAQRVEGQGKVLAGLTTNLGQIQRSQERLEKQVGALATAGPAAIRGGAPLASPLLAQRLGGLEKQIASLAQAQARPSRQELAAAKRLAEMEKSLNEVKKQAAAATRADPRLNSRINSLEKKVAAETSEGRALDRRLDLLEKKLTAVAARPASAPAVRPATAPAVRPAPAAEPKTVRIVHVVRPGQTLYGLARGYGVKMRQIKEWNPNLGARDKLYIGEKLVIVVRK